MTIDTTFLLVILWDLERIFQNLLIKMTVMNELNNLDNKIRANRAQVDLDKKYAEISALSSDEIEKYEYLPGEDLEVKPSVVSKAKFEYSPLGRVFNEVLDKSNKKEVLKRLKNIEGKNKDQLNKIEYQGEK